MYKSEIRESQLERLREKVEKRNYNKYLYKISLIKCRAFQDEVVQFRFPVTALIGPNGGGKTTILGASALLYESVAPRQFFTRNRQLDQDMKDWSITYEAVDRETNERDMVRRTAHFSKEKWSRDTLKRNVIFEGVNRTLPAVERSNLSRFANKNIVFRPEEITMLNGSSAYITKILGKDVSEYQIAQSDRYGNIKLLSGQTDGGKSYSEFHFGAGESSIIKMVLDIENANDNSMVLIEEIENGLHPVAVMRLVDYLIDAADRKKLQIIFTTHSEYAIRSLPAEAVWASVNGKAINGKLDILSLRSLTGEVNSELIIYTEDVFAKEWVLSMLRTQSSIATDAIEIYPMGGDGVAVHTNKNNNSNPGQKTRSICVIDGDSMQEESKVDYVFRLPGEAPERVVFNEVIDCLEECAGLLAVRCMRQFRDDKEMVSAILGVKRTNYDHHLVFSQIGEKIGFVSEGVVRAAFLTTWCELYPHKVDEFINKIEGFLPLSR